MPVPNPRLKPPSFRSRGRVRKGWWTQGWQWFRHRRWTARRTRTRRRGPLSSFPARTPDWWRNVAPRRPAPGASGRSDLRSANCWRDNIDMSSDQIGRPRRQKRERSARSPAAASSARRRSRRWGGLACVRSCPQDIRQWRKRRIRPRRMLPERSRSRKVRSRAGADRSRGMESRSARNDWWRFPPSEDRRASATVSGRRSNSLLSGVMGRVCSLESVRK